MSLEAEATCEAPPEDTQPLPIPLPTSADPPSYLDFPIALHKGKRDIGCKWVYTIKMDSNGSVAHLKARIIAKGYAQTYGVDFTNTFSHVAKLNSIRILISLAATHH